MKDLWKVSGWVLVLLVFILLQGCGDSKNSSPLTSEAPINPATLDSAASFLAAATGKDNPIDIDQVIFVNSVLGLNQPDQNPNLASSASHDSSMGCLYGDLWVTYRDEYGVPILDEQGCEQPIASQPIELPVLDDEGNPVLDENGNPLTYLSNTVPMSLEEYMDGELKCEVVPDYVDYTMPVELGRLNMVRSSVKNPDTMARAFEEAMKNINAAIEVKSDFSGRLVLVSEADLLDEFGNVIGTKLVESTIDSPRENLALYRALMVNGRLAGLGVEKIGDEGQTIPAPWLEIQPDIELGDLSYLRSGTEGRYRGVGLFKGYADLSVAFHSTEFDYAGQSTDYVQFHPELDPLPADYCPYTDENDEIWTRVFANDLYHGDNIRAFAKHAEDARRMIKFMHKVIQDVPFSGTKPELEAHNQVNNIGHSGMPEIVAGNHNRHLLFETAAAALGAASGKHDPLSVDAVVFINSVLRINDLGEISPRDLYGDLWVLKRDENGVPLHDDLGCVMPIASEPIFITVIDENGEPQTIELDTVPMMLEEYMDGLFKCAPVVGYEEYVMEVEMGRLNCSRSSLNNPGKMDKHLYEVVNRINAAVAIKRDLAGRIVLTSEENVYDESGTIIGTRLVDSTIDSPMENIAIYRALMQSGTLEVPVTVNIEGTKQTFTLEITLPEAALDDHGMAYLKYGDGSLGSPRGIGHHQNGYADFSEISHCPWADYEGVPVDFVERLDEFCPYGDKNDQVWSRVLKGEVGAEGDDVDPASNIAAFVQHADNSRRVIVFMHSVIHDPVAGL